VTIGFAVVARPSTGVVARISRAAPALTILLLIAAVARLVPALVLPLGADYDIESFRMVTDALLGGREVYAASLGRHPYLPFQMFIMGGMALLSRATGLPYVVAIKLPAIAADVALTGLIYYTLTRQGARRETAVTLALLYALNPVSLVVSAYHGQFESVTLLLLVVSWLLWHFGRRAHGSAAVLGLAILNKTWPIVLLPVMLLRGRNHRSRLVYGALALGVPVLATVLYLLLTSTAPQTMLNRALTHRGVPGYWGLSAVLAPLGRSVPAAQALFDALVAIRNWLLAAAVLLALWRTRRQSALVAMLTVIVCVMAVTVGFGNQWLLWPLPLALLARQERAARWYSLTAAVMMITHFFGPSVLTWLGVAPGAWFDWLYRLSALPCWMVVVVWAWRLLHPAGAAPPTPVAGRQPVVWLAALGLVAVPLLALTQTQPDISDPIGYVYAGQRLAQGQGLTFEDANNTVAGPYFSLYAFQIARPGDSRHYLGFPPGFPLLLAAGSVAGADSRAIHYVVPLLAVLTLAATFYLGFYLADDPAAGLWAAGVLAATAAFWEFGTAAWSEIPATLATAAGTALFLRSRRARRQLPAILAALILSFGIFIRYTNVLFLAAPAAYELVSARRGVLTERWRRPFWAVCALGVAAVPLFNHVYYGGATLTSYSPLHGWYASPAFSLSYALGPSFVGGYSLRETLRALWQNFPVLLLGSPFGLALLPAASRALVAAAVVAGLAPYAVYAFAPAGINSRFLLPLFPFLAVAIAQLLTVALRRLPRPAARRAVGLALAVALVLPAVARWDDLRARNVAADGGATFIRDLTAALEPNAVVLSYVYNDALVVYANRSALNYRRIPISDPQLGRYRTEMLEACLVGSVNRLLAQATPVYYIEDTQPPYWDSLAILNRHFELSGPTGSPPVYRVVAPRGAAALDESLCRLP
jgi:hypothetical protein